MWQTALKLGYGVVLEFGSKVDPLPNASGGVDFEEFPFPGSNPNFFPNFFGVSNSPETGLQGGTGVWFISSSTS